MTGRPAVPAISGARAHGNDRFVAGDLTDEVSGDRVKVDYTGAVVLIPDLG